MEQELAGRVAVVTGASKGIGLAVVRALTAQGARVAAGARTVSAELAELTAGGAVTALAVDLGTPDGPGELVEAAVSAYGGLDVLVNNVGAVFPRLGGFTSVTDEDWLAGFNINLMSAVRATRAAVPHLLARGGGAIVTVSSINAFYPDPAIIDYTSSKAALTNFSKALSKELGPKNIRVNTVSPGPVATPLWLDSGGVADQFAKASGATAEQVKQQVAAAAATGRFTTPEEVADVVAFLSGPRAANLTGTDLTIDGGYTPTL
ncbi:3-oxoacyl-ACP reductase [Catellatospora sp. TT07R-123]|uniref:oxidoreductase n=1 Tax=Catellatospora sp. TT07R-123 TaxID=2733863 RepID=UPI001B1A447C|nr:oxidoreductase [Catellatospora sp. TT07R-123]GHJ45165.1 3-oxoacyl-ACP reductase [Catellatospora sp. TT07R-123]